jgi:hypothetical protein
MLHSGPDQHKRTIAYTTWPMRRHVDTAHRIARSLDPPRTASGA